MIEINGREFNDLQKFVSEGRYLCGKYLTEKLFVVSIKDVAIKVCWLIEIQYWTMNNIDEGFRMY